MKTWHLALYVAILVLVIAKGWIDYRSRHEEILTMYRNQAAATAAAIAHSGSRQAGLSEDLELSYIQRALDLISTVDRLDREDLLTPARLNELTQTSNFIRISIYNDQMDQIMGSTGLPGLGRGPMGRPISGPGLLGMLRPLFAGERDTLIVGAGGGPQWARHR
ncbi:hypothetical protein ACFL4K_03455, partial [Candidatus Neomarinimicrobiota bacterium]